MSIARNRTLEAQPALRTDEPSADVAPHKTTLAHPHTSTRGAVSRSLAKVQRETYNKIEVYQSRNGPIERIITYDKATNIRLSGHFDLQGAPHLGDIVAASESRRKAIARRGAHDSKNASAGSPHKQSCNNPNHSSGCYLREAVLSDRTVTPKRPANQDIGSAGVRSTDRTEEVFMEDSKQDSYHRNEVFESGEEEEEEQEEEEEVGEEGEEQEEEEEEDEEEDDEEEQEYNWRQQQLDSAWQTDHSQSKRKSQQMVVDGSEEGMEEEYEDIDESDHDSVGTGYTEEESESDQDVDDAVREEMESFRQDFKGISKRYRLINKIGEGTFSSVYKAEDLHYDKYDNSWDLESQYEDEGYNHSPPPTKRRRFNGDEQIQTRRRRPKYVAIKKIYVTSSPQRIMNELELLHSLRGCKDVVPLITAFRHLDQVVAVLPYFKHVDFRNYFRSMKIPDMKLYFRSLFRALAHVHEQKIIHRDIKPTNFLYDLARGRGVLVDFGLAEREGTDATYCPCQGGSSQRDKWSLSTHPQAPSTGYIKNDPRPARRANRAGTRGFRAPEVLFKCTSQTTKIDIWSAGVVLLTMLSKRFPFFNSADDVDAMIEIATMFGKARMRACAALHGATFETTIPTIGERGYTLEKIIMWATSRIAGGGGDTGRDAKMPEDEKIACHFLGRCLELDPAKRMSAKEALQHDLLREGDEEDEEEEDEDEDGDEDEEEEQDPGQGQEDEEGEEEDGEGEIEDDGEGGEECNEEEEGDDGEQG